MRQKNSIEDHQSLDLDIAEERLETPLSNVRVAIVALKFFKVNLLILFRERQWILMGWAKKYCIP